MGKAILVFSLMLTAFGCSSNSGNNLTSALNASSDNNSNSNSLSLSPLAPSVAAGGDISFSASGGSGSGYVFSSSVSGLINSSSGFFIAPSSAASITVTVEDSSGNTASTIVTVLGGNVITISPTSLSLGTTTTLTASGGNGNYTFDIVGAANPYGSVTSAGVFSATEVGSVSVIVQDSDGNRGQATISVVTPTSHSLNSIYTMSSAYSNNVLSGWPANGVIPADNNNGAVIYSSNQFSSNSNNGFNPYTHNAGNNPVYLDVYSSSVVPMDDIVLFARCVNRSIGGSTNALCFGFPESYEVYVINADYSLSDVGTFTNQPNNPMGIVGIQLSKVYQAIGFRIEPITLDVDNYGHYYFQMAFASMDL